MPRLTIDDREIEVPAGTKVIDAAEMLGIAIPRFCYHRALGAVGACRVCAVKVLEGKPSGIQMSCMLDAADGMVVSTVDEEAVAFRKRVVELLMINHPHDCPVCDEGGHCLLQDLTVAGGHGTRFYRGKKKTFADQDLGPLVQHEMNRCIRCYRCSRFYQEFCGYFDLGVMQIGSRVYYGRFRDGTLESPFAGNLTDICPTGVYTDKPSRYKGRRWDFQRTPSVCIHCGLGCSITVDARYREIVRHEARFDENVNGWFICDRGRFGFHYANDPARPREARIDGKRAAFPVALEAARSGIAEIVERHGENAVAWAGSHRNCLETMAVLAGIAKKGAAGPMVSLFRDGRSARAVRTAVARLSPEVRVSMRDLEKADMVVAAGVDPVNEAPMLALALRRAARNGASVTIVDPRPVEAPFDLRHVPAADHEIAGFLARLIRECGSGDSLEKTRPGLREHCDAVIAKSAQSDDREREIADLAKRIASCKRPAVVCGTMICDDLACDLAADLAEVLSLDRNSGLFYVMEGPGSFAAGLFPTVGSSFEDLLEGIEEGRIKALAALEFDPFVVCGDRERVRSALDRLEFLAVADCLDSETAKAADVVLPTATIHESGGVFVNQEGRARRLAPCLEKGASVEQAGKGSHPPRAFSQKAPGQDVFPAWQILKDLLDASERKSPPSCSETIFACLGDVAPRLANLDFSGEFPPEGKMAGAPAAGEKTEERREMESVPDPPPENYVRVLLVENAFGTEELSSLSPCLKPLEKGGLAKMHPETMDELGLSDGDGISIGEGDRAATLTVAGAENMAKNTAVVPRRRSFPWRVFRDTPANIDKQRIRRVD